MEVSLPDTSAVYDINNMIQEMAEFEEILHRLPLGSRGLAARLPMARRFRLEPQIDGLGRYALRWEAGNGDCLTVQAGIETKEELEDAAKTLRDELENIVRKENPESKVGGTK